MTTLKLIACDLDGTLLLNGAQSLHDDTCGLIRQLIGGGVLFCAGSGRQYTNLRRLFEPVKDQIAYLCENGSLIYYQDRLIHKESMDRSAALELIREIQSTHGSEVLVSGEKVCYITPKDISYYYHMRDVVKNDVVLMDDIEKIPEDILKISIYEKGGIHNAEYWRDRYKDSFNVAIGGGEWLDIMPKGVNKAFGLNYLLKDTRILPEECMAVGDNDNDREILGLCGFPAAVKSAKPEIRALARFETDTVENLFRRILSGRMNLERNERK